MARRVRQAEEANLQGSPPVEELEVNVRRALQDLADHSAPDLSLVFIALFIGVSYFHETHFTYTSIAVAGWLLLQLSATITRDDFRNELFWNILSLGGNLVFYLFLGYCWSMAKLYLDIWQGHLPAELLQTIRVCISKDGAEGCVFTLLGQIKWYIVHWMITWPFNLAYTLTRDPLRLFTDLIFDWSRQRYLTIITAAMFAHDNQSLDAETSWSVLGYYVLVTVGYFAIGYAWTHAKLFIDIWQGTLPERIDTEARRVYNGDQNYWSLVMSLKWIVFQWMIIWPFSIVYTLLRHPFRIIAEFLYTLSIKKYAYIVGRALTLRFGDSAPK